MEVFRSKAFIGAFSLVLLIQILQLAQVQASFDNPIVDELLYDFEHVDRTRAYDVGQVLESYRAFFATETAANLEPSVREGLLRNATHLSRFHRILKALEDCEAEDLRNKKGQIKEALLEVRPCPEPTVAPDILPEQADGLLRDVQLALEQVTEHDTALAVHDAKKRAYRNAFRNFLEFGYLFYEGETPPEFPELESSLSEFCNNHCGDDIRKDLRENYESLKGQVQEKIDLGYTARMSYEELAANLNERVDALNMALERTLGACSAIADAKKKIEIIDANVAAAVLSENWEGRDRLLEERAKAETTIASLDGSVEIYKFNYYQVYDAVTHDFVGQLIHSDAMINTIGKHKDEDAFNDFRCDRPDAMEHFQNNFRYRRLGERVGLRRRTAAQVAKAAIDEFKGLLYGDVVKRLQRVQDLGDVLRDSPNSVVESLLRYPSQIDQICTAIEKVDQIERNRRRRVAIGRLASNELLITAIAAGTGIGAVIRAGQWGARGIKVGGRVIANIASRGSRARQVASATADLARRAEQGLIGFETRRGTLMGALSRNIARGDFGLTALQYAAADVDYHQRRREFLTKIALGSPSEESYEQLMVLEEQREVYESAFLTLMISRASFWGKINPTHQFVNPYQQRMMDHIRSRFTNNKLVQALEGLDEGFAQRAERLVQQRVTGKYINSRVNQMDNAIRTELRRASEVLTQQMTDADGVQEVAALTWAVQNTPPDVQRGVSNMISKYGLESPAAQQFLDTIQELAVSCMEEASNPRCSDSGLHSYVNLNLQTTLNTLAKEAEAASQQ